MLVSEDGQQFPLTRWQRVYPALPISAFPAQDCVQALALNQNASLPEDCRNRLALLTLSTPEIFWTRTSFEVRLNNQSIGNCALGVGVCHLRLP